MKKSSFFIYFPIDFFVSVIFSNAGIYSAELLLKFSAELYYDISAIMYVYI